EPLDAGEHLEQRSGDPMVALGRLVGIGRGADRDRLALERGLPQALQESLGRPLLDEDLALEVLPLAEIEEVVGVAGVAVGAAELAAPVGVDRPGERHAIGRAAVQDLADLETEILDAGPGADGLGIGIRPADRRGEREDGEEGLRGHTLYLRLPSGRCQEVFPPFLRLDSERGRTGGRRTRIPRCPSCPRSKSSAGASSPTSWATGSSARKCATTACASRSEPASWRAGRQGAGSRAWGAAASTCSSTSKAAGRSSSTSA